MALRQLLTRAARQAQPALSRGFAGDVGACAGTPEEILARKVLIYAPARSSSQHAPQFVPTWKLSFGESERWENPLLGWTSTADPLANVARTTLEFDTKEDAIRFVEKNGWKWEVQEPHKISLGSSIIKGAGKRGTRVKQYADNFTWMRKGKPIWPHPGFPEKK